MTASQIADVVVSEYPNPLDDDTQAVSLNDEAGLVVLHESTGALSRFEDAHDQDADGFAIFREQPAEVAAFASTHLLATNDALHVTR
jgi:hypothetical protein